MKGFDPEFVDIVDYILRITYRIWEGRQVDLCQDYYSDDCPVYTSAGLTVGAEEVVQNTLNTLAAFPDRTLHADAIICGGNDTDGYHSSHLIDTQMTNLGDSDLGTASGKHARIKVIAHCVIKANKIIEEWLVRDNYSLVEQLGFDPHTIARQKARDEPQARFTQWRDKEIERLLDNNSSQRLPYPDVTNGAEEAFIRAALQNIWNAGQIGDVHKVYAADAKLHASANRELNGYADIEQFYLQLIQTLPGLEFSVDYVCQQAYRVTPEDTTAGLHLAVRWTLVGQHTGNVLYGEPSGATVLMLGESQYHLVDGKIQEEWTVFDELASLTQIYRARLNTISLQAG